MAAPWFLPGKFDPPPAPAVRIERGFDPPVPVTLLVAGPGYGKSTALAAAGPDVWVGLDPGDADAATFFYALVLGVRGRIPGFGEDVLALAASAEPKRVWAAFFGAIAAYNLPGFVLALDDLHHAYAVPGLMEGLAATFERLPCRLLLAARQRFPVGLARLRAR
ncbi:MAG: transcriptional regulator, partial [Cyanobacteria bacterium RYN_339]|nr:transcriptional regulator [Cyanobacteria bacterium RYN_339]